MSDEQWLWLFVNQRVDADERLEKMCPKCREEVTSEHRCIRCGKEIIEQESFINPNFDMDRYNMLAEADGISDRVEDLYREDNDSDDDTTTDAEDIANLDDDEFLYDE